jgi:hypothetical protein
MKMGNKYGAKKITDPATGFVFDSKKEFTRWCELRILERAGKISCLQRQVKYELIPKQKGERACNYVADFVYIDSDGNKVVEDTKGVRTDAYRIKRKLMLWIHGIRIKET